MPVAVLVLLLQADALGGKVVWGAELLLWDWIQERGSSEQDGG